MNPNNFSNEAAARLILRARKRLARLDAAEVQQFHQLTAVFDKLAPGTKLTAQQVIQLHKLAEKCHQ